MPAYLADLQSLAVEGRIGERVFIGFLERLLDVVTTEQALDVFTELQIDRQTLFEGLGREKLPGLAAFLGKRLPRALSR